MKAWKNFNQAEWHIDEAEVSNGKLEMTMHAHLDEPRTSAQDNKHLLSVMNLVKRRVLVTFAEFVQVKGLEETKGDIRDQVGGEKVP